MFYAVKSIDNQIVNKIYRDWDTCKQAVLGHPSVYKSFKTEEEATSFLKDAPSTAAEFSQGYNTLSDTDRKFYGKYVLSRYFNEENGFTIAIYQMKNGGRVCCKGYNLPTNKRLVYCFAGKVANNQKFGKEFIVESFKAHITDSKESIVTYLCNSNIKGIGEKTALRIWETFHADAIRILEEEPEKLSIVKGISRKKARQIADSYKENAAAKEITMFLQKYGISAAYAAKVYRIYKGTSVETVKENPYVLCNIRGITFEDADEIAMDLGLPQDSRERIEAAVRSTISEYMINTGDTVMEQNRLGQAVMEKLHKARISPEVLFDRICNMIRDRKLRCTTLAPQGKGKSKYLSIPYFYDMEYQLAENLTRLLQEEDHTDLHNMDRYIQEGERKFHIELDEVQQQAIRNALLNPVSIITGAPGTGKTTLCKVLDYCYTHLYKDYDTVYLAPTGRAARKMTESIGKKAQTIHSKVKLYGDRTPSEEEETIINNALVLGDEFSMADVVVAATLFRACSTGCKLVLMGDTDQLPSVGPGAVLRDLIESGLIPVTNLERVYRQDKNTQLYSNIKKISKGNTDIVEAKDFHFTECADMEFVRNTMLQKVKYYVGIYGIENVMCLCPYKEHTAGIKDMNTLLQEELNPPAPSKKELSANGMIFREGDIVMNLTNNEDAANGDIGIISHVYYNPEDSKSTCIQVKMNGKQLVYPKDRFEELTLAYAMTVHKAQGSEADAVITTVMKFHKGMLYRAIPYVACSRGRQIVEVCGQKEAFDQAVQTEKANLRVTLTPYFLAKLNYQFTYIS